MEFRPKDPCNFPDEWHGSYLDTLTSGCIPVGHELFEVWAMENPEAMGGSFYQIGHIEMTSEMVTSLYGDTRLFFRHVRTEEDLEERPEWKEHIEFFDRPTFVKNLPLKPEAPADCPFAFMYGMI